MGEASNKSKGSVKKWFAGLKAEFKRIIWPTKASVIRQTVVVTVITVILGVLISLIDQLIQFGLDNIEQTIENRKLQDQILEVSVPIQEAVEIKNGVKKVTQKKMFPGYVLINMVMNDDTWYVVRNTRGVTGFVGPGSKPVPLTDAEMLSLGINKGPVTLEFSEGDTVAVIKGVWEGTAGVIKRIDENRQTVTINVDMFGRETPVELDFTEVKKMD